MILTRQEKQAVSITSLIIALRLLGIFLILPIFSTYAIKYPGATLTLAGIAFGIYALAQSFLQIPFGWASDRFGRKPILLIGLFLLALGSIICGIADNINHLILARFLQGSGAVSAVAMAALGDLTRPQVRAQAFTISGIAIGIAFIFGLLGGPFLAAHLGFSSLFYILAALSLFAMLLTGLFFPTIKTENSKQDESGFAKLINHVEIRRLYLATFITSFGLNMFFFTYPLSWTQIGLHQAELWKVYLIIFIPSALFIFPYVRRAEKKGKLQLPTLAAWFFLILSFGAYIAFGIQKWMLYATGIAFFLGYTLFQSLLPAFLTQRVTSEIRGSATGFYTLAGFIGSAMGGMLAGVFYDYNNKLPLVVSFLFLIVWAFIGLPSPPDPDSMN
ncbi:MAG: MFS transporter [Deltaproteobacteria bacterium]|nr:MFS transporter [Deltaproteobacteria bacterium]